MFQMMGTESWFISSELTVPLRQSNTTQTFPLVTLFQVVNQVADHVQVFYLDLSPARPM